MKKTIWVNKAIIQLIILFLLIFNTSLTTDALAFFETTPTPEPAELNLWEALQIKVKDNPGKTPAEGDQLTAYFKLKNIGDETLYLDNYGVTGTCGGDDWSLYAGSALTLNADEFQVFSENLSGTLPVGTCDFTVHYQDDSGWQTIGSTTSFTVEAAPTEEPTETPTEEPTPELAEISLYIALELSVKNQTYWPPVSGDYLKAYFKLKNVGGTATTLTDHRVSGTCNSESWTLAASASVTLEPNDYVIFDNYSSNPLSAGDCSLVVEYQDAEGWHSIGATEDFTVGSESEPTATPTEVSADLQLYSPLDLSVKNSDSWPPVEGNLLKYSFKIKNMGEAGSSVTINNYGVYGVCNGTEVWEVYANEAATLGSHEYRYFSGYFGTGLVEGPCSFVVKYQDDEGWHEIGETESFTVQETAPGKLEFYYTLRFWVKENDRWPPVAGDKLYGYFKLKNTGGQAIVIDNMGISGTLNGSGEIEVLKNASLTLEPGQHFIFEKLFSDPLAAGDYDFIVKIKQDGSWSDMGEHFYFTVSETDQSTPAELILYHDFSLTVKNNEDRWPPQENDILIAYFKIKNTGGQTAYLDNLGVSGTRNGTEEWDLFINDGITLKPDEYYIFSMKYETPLSAGEYDFQPYYLDDGGWHAIGDNIEFTIQSEDIPLPVPSISSDLLLYSEGSGEWPPLVDDQLLGFFMIQNESDQPMNLEKIGIYGTKNENDSWSLYYPEAVSVAPGEYWVFDKEFANKLVAGDYKFVISYKDASGWQTLGSYSEFSVEEQTDEQPPNVEANVLDLRVVGSANWPPYIGEFVEASFLLSNTSDQDKYYDAVGVYGTKDGSEEILLTYPGAVTVKAGETWAFSKEFENAFEAGTYLLTIYVIDDGGFHTLSEYTYFVVDTTAPVGDAAPDPSGSPDPDETPTPTPTLDPENNDGGEGNEEPNGCTDDVGGWIECNIVNPLKGLFCWLKQLFNPEAICEE